MAREPFRFGIKDCPAPGIYSGTDLLTYSSEQTFATCRRLYYWRYELGWRPKRQAKNLRLGAALHEGIDMLARGSHLDDIETRVESIYDDHKTAAANWPDAEQGIDDLGIECTTVQCLIDGYRAAWGESRIEIIESETVFNLPILNPATGKPSRTFRQAGKRDRIGRLPDGRLVLMETKTISTNIEPDSDYWHLLALNQQITKYMLAALAEGIDVQSALYDVIRKPTIKPIPVPVLDEHQRKIVRNPDGSRAYTQQHKPRQVADKSLDQLLVTEPMTPSQWRYVLGQDIAKRPGYYYGRQEIPRLQSDLDEYRQELWWIAETIRDCRRTAHWFRNCGACQRYNRICDYYPLCTGERDITAGVPAGFRQAEIAHEELQEPKIESVA